MRLVKKPGSGRAMGLLEPGERLPANHPGQVLRRRGDQWYQVYPREDPRARDPQTGDHLPARTVMAKETGQASIRHDAARERFGEDDRRRKAARVASSKRTTRKR